MGFTLYLLRFTPLESPAACSGDGPRKTSGLLRGEDIIPSGPEAFRARGLLERTPLEIYL